MVWTWWPMEEHQKAFSNPVDNQNLWLKLHHVICLLRIKENNKEKEKHSNSLRCQNKIKQNKLNMSKREEGIKGKTQRHFNRESTGKGNVTNRQFEGVGMKPNSAKTDWYIELQIPGMKENSRYRLHRNKRDKAILFTIPYILISNIQEMDKFFEKSNNYKNSPR